MVLASQTVGGTTKSVVTPTFEAEPTMESHAQGTVGKPRRSDSRPPGSGDAILASNDPDAAAVVTALNQGLAIARLLALRCEQQYLSALRSHFPSLAAASLELAYEARAHRDAIFARIGELGGKPDAARDAPVPRRRLAPLDGSSRVGAISDLRADARAAIDGYRRIAASVEPFDPTTKELIEEILSCEERRAGDLGSLLKSMSTHPER